MSDPHAGQAMPRSILLAAGAVLIFSLGLTFAAKSAGVGTLRAPSALAVHTRNLRFEDRADGAVTALDAANGAQIHLFLPGTNGFVRGVLRGMARERKLESIGAGACFELTRWSDGRLSIRDTETGRTVDLNAFGAENAAAFAALLGEAR